MKVNSIGQENFIGVHKTLSEEIWQDDPEVSKILPCKCVRRFTPGQNLCDQTISTLIVRTAANEIETFEGLHPEIMLEGVFKKGYFFRQLAYEQNFQEN